MKTDEAILPEAEVENWTRNEILAFVWGFMFARGVHADLSVSRGTDRTTLHVAPDAEAHVEACTKAVEDVFVAMPVTWQIQIMPIGWTQEVR